ncbi:MAG: glycosyltransferase family 4 protein [PVC group bacterium]|nr:glycosyltransferase family 4 protein [PVC group bacterium]
MNVLILSSDYYGNIGGKTTHILMLEKGLREQGYSVETFYFIDHQNFFIKVLVSGLGRVFDLFKIGVFYRNSMLKLILRCILKSYLKTKQFDVINAQDPVALLAASECSGGEPLVLTNHGELTNELKASGQLQGLREKNCILNMEKSSYEVADKIIVVDERIKKHVIDILPQAKDKVFKLYNFMDVLNFRKKIDSVFVADVKKEFNLNPDKNHVLASRRLVLKNGVMFAVKSLEILLKKYKVSGHVLLIVGSGPELLELKKYVEDKDLKEVVLFVGDIAYEEMFKYYRVASAVLVPSIDVDGYKEATSLSVLEAMVAGVPVIASRLGGLAEIIENERTGILVEQKDAEGIAQAILKLSNNQEYTSRLTRNAYDYVLHNHNYKEAVQKVIAIYS